jgi:hypothetical protein
MKRVINLMSLLSTILFFCVTFAFGTSIPEFGELDKEDFPPPILGDLPVQQPEESPLDDLETEPLPLLTPEEAIHEARHASGVLYLSLLKDWGIEEDRPNLAEDLGPESDMGELAPDQVVLGTYNASSDTYQDVEPSVISMDRDGVYYTCTAYISYRGTTRRNYFSTTTDFVNFTRGQIPMPAGYLHSGDPLLDENIYNSGIGPRRMYLTGIVFNNDPVGSFGVPNGIGIWRSDNGGLSWTAPYVIVNNSSSYILDKPDIGVSWHSGSLGYVYVAYVRITYGDANATRLFVARSTNGGITFGTPIQVTTGFINGAQILVNPFYGTVYALWTDFGTNRIRMSVSTDYGQHWTAPENAANGEMVPPTDYPLNGLRKAGSICMARFNSAANRISVVWHEFDTIPGGGQDTNIYYASKTPSGWQPKARLNDDSGYRDQFMPALDFDTNGGNLIVTFYDRRDDPSNLRYHEYMTRISPAGVNLAPNARVSTFQTNPTSYSNWFIGDYQDLWSQTV